VFKRRRDVSGHSKWSSIKHRKGAADAKRGKIFSRLIKEIIVSARLGGGDPSGNPRLRQAILAGKAENLPKENIERAVKKGTGELEGVKYEEVSYEGYGPGGAAVLVETLTDNKNRATAEVRHLFSKYGGNLGEPGCVSWLFDKRGIIVFDKDEVKEETLMNVVLDAGAEDIQETEREFEVISDSDSLENVKEAVENAQLSYSFAEVTMYPQNTVKLDGRDAERMLKLMEALEDSDDVQKVYANFDISAEVMEELSGL
jgi:YebC/PmpR family DNA-binding regulatory protein